MKDIELKCDKYIKIFLKPVANLDIIRNRKYLIAKKIHYYIYTIF